MSKNNRESPSETHAFDRRPHATFIRLSVPVLFALIAEPLTALVDTGFVSFLGADYLAALGVGTVCVSGVLWIFNFLSIGTQTEVAQSAGRGDEGAASRACTLAVTLGLVFGLFLMLASFFLNGPVVRLMGATGGVADGAVSYMAIRFMGAPAVLITFAVFGALRGQQDMRAPLWIALSVNALNLCLDPLLIFGLGPFPRMDLAGAATATTISQWLGALAATIFVFRRLGRPSRPDFREATHLFKVGVNLFLRTGLLTLFLILATRSATRLGADSGAAHQVVRQVWIFTALFLDAFAVSSQSLVGYFVGALDLNRAHRVARISCAWSVGTGAALALGMWLSTPWVTEILVPPSARGVFVLPWLLAAVSQPINALSFATDGIHWGTRDFKFLRQAMTLATLTGGIFLLVLDQTGTNTMTVIWLVTILWVSIRAGCGVLRIWPGIGNAPLTHSD